MCLSVGRLEVEQNVLGGLGRELSAADAAVIAFEEAAELAARRDAIARMPQGDYEAARMAAGFGRSRRLA